MFWNKTPVIVETPKALVRVARPVGTLVSATTDDNEVRAYAKIAAKIGFEPDGLIDARIRLWFAQQNVRIFKYREVMHYLKDKAPKGELVVWRPLREQDRTKEWGWGRNDEHDHYHDREWACRTYGHLIPLRVLDTVARLIQAVGDRPKFFVSHYEAPRPDPFIMVTLRDTDRIIFDVWDEPGFVG